MLSTFVALLVVRLAWASPAALPAASCSSINQNCPSGSVSQYCSSYLQVPTQTRYPGRIPVTTTTITVTPTSAVGHCTIATITEPSTTSTSTFYSTITSTQTVCNNILIQKRAIATIIDKPSCLSQYTQSYQISSACSCVPITPATTVVSATSTSTKSVTVTARPVTSTITGTCNGKRASTVFSGTATSTTTVTETSTSTTLAPDPTGFQFAAYYNNQGENTGPLDYYDVFDPQYVKAAPAGQSPSVLYTGVATSNAELDKNSNGQFTYEYRGYIYGVVAGLYTVQFDNVDDIAFFWMDDIARSGWERGSEFLSTYYFDGPGYDTRQVLIQQGQYHAFRFMWANGGGPGTITFNIFDPTGVPILSDTSTGSPAIVQYSCDVSSMAPPFEGDFGAEPA